MFVIQSEFLVHHRSLSDAETVIQIHFHMTSLEYNMDALYVACMHENSISLLSIVKTIYTDIIHIYCTSSGRLSHSVVSELHAYVFARSFPPAPKHHQSKRGEQTDVVPPQRHQQ